MGRAGPEPADRVFIPAWLEPDFNHAPIAKLTVTDFWNPIPPDESLGAPSFPHEPKRQQHENERPPLVLTAVDSWFPAGAPPAIDDGAGQQFDSVGTGIHVPLFDARQAENPFRIKLRRHTPEELGHKRARWLVALLDVPEVSRQRDFVSYFERLFDQFPHINTFRALANHAVTGASAESLRNGCTFRLRWLETPEWWAVRAWRPQTISSGNPDSLLTWSRALRFAHYCGGGDPFEVIGHDWIWDWMVLPAHEDSRWRFVDFAEERLKAHSAGIWDLSTLSETGLAPACLEGQFPLKNLRSRTGALLRSSEYSYGVDRC